jgi:hypothetical protein
MVTSAGLDKIPSRCLVRIHLCSWIQSQNDPSSSQPRLFNKFTFPRGLHSRPSDQFGRELSIVGSHPYLPKYLYYKATDWRSFAAIISRTDVLFILIWTFITGLCREIQDHCAGKCYNELRRKVLRNFLVVYHSHCMQVKLAKHSGHSFLSYTRIMTKS